LRRRLGAPLKRYLDARFDAIETRLDILTAWPQRADPLASVDVSEHNEGSAPPTFAHVVSQLVSAGQFTDPDFVRLLHEVYPGGVELPTGGTPGIAPHRKVWEYIYVLRAAEQHGVLQPGRTALGFGVGTEPLPAALARCGVAVLATDQDVTSDAGGWVTSGQHMSELRALSRPEIVPDDVLRELVQLRYVDMTAIPDDLGTFDLVWSCCAFEHLGSPEAGLSFVRNTLPLLRPGGVCVHTTELELTPRTTTAEYANIVVYRKEDLDGLADDVRARGFEMETNWYVALETPTDRYISLPPHSEAHLKLALGESVFTSAGLLVRRPMEMSSPAPE
jgi:SAM-dependent methyltransferase